MSIIMSIIVIYIPIQLFIAPIFIFIVGGNSECNAIDFVIFNPIQIFKMTRLNRFGAWCTAMFACLVFLPWAIGYWIYKAFTIGG